MQLHNKTAIVTGAASGIGKEIARQFVGEGAKVAIADLNLEAARAAAEEIDPGGAATLAVRMDVTDEDEVENGVEEICHRFGGIDVLVSNAGIQIVRPSTSSHSPTGRRCSRSTSTARSSRPGPACRTCTRRADGGTIIYMGSVHSKEASSAEGAVRHGQARPDRPREDVAKEGAEHGVRANVICPGFVRTPLVEKQIPEQAKELGITEEDVIKKVMLKETVDGEFTTLDDVAELRRVLRGLPVKCADRPVARRQPRLVHAVISRTKQNEHAH